MEEHSLSSHLLVVMILNIIHMRIVDIVRYVVYVETDYDTDGDGKPDLVKTFVQVPKAAVKGIIKLRQSL